MRRRLAYTGSPVLLTDVRCTSVHSLIDQSLHFRLGAETTVLEPDRTLVLRLYYQLPPATPSIRGLVFFPGRMWTRSGASICGRPPVAGPTWWSGSSPEDRERSPGQSTCWREPSTSSCKPASSITCGPGSVLLSPAG
jgi:hypothetical protein